MTSSTAESVTSVKKIELTAQVFGVGHESWLTLFEKAAGANNIGITVNKMDMDRYQAALNRAKIMVVVNHFDLLLHGRAALDIVNFCYDHGYGIDIKGNVEMVTDYLASLLVAERHMPLHVAQHVVNQIFPEGKFLHNEKLL